MSSLFLGGLPSDIQSDEIRDLFSKYGTIHSIVIKRNYAFLTYADPSTNNKDAIDSLNGYMLSSDNGGGNHNRMTVQEARGKAYSSGGGAERDRGDKSCYKCHQTGHLSFNCQEQQQHNNERRPMTCYTCQKVGHKSFECTAEQRGRATGRDRARSRSPIPRDDYHRGRPHPREYERREERRGFDGRAQRRDQPAPAPRGYGERSAAPVARQRVERSRSPAGWGASPGAKLQMDRVDSKDHLNSHS